MQFLFSLLGCAAAWALIGASFAYVFAPSEIQRFLRTVGGAVAVVFFVLFTIGEMAHAVDSFAFMVAVLAISPVAYLIRARRARRAERPPNLRGAERTPIMPRRFPGDRT